MTRITLDLPEETAARLEEKAKAANFPDAATFLQATVHHLMADPEESEEEIEIPLDEAQLPPDYPLVRTGADLRRMLDEAYASGPGIPVDEAYWADLDRRILERIEAGRQANAAPGTAAHRIEGGGDE